MPRTIGTLQEVVYGLYPTEKTSNGTVPRLRVREPQDEDLMGNSYVCARLKELMLAFETGQNVDLLLLENVLIFSYMSTFSGEGEVQPQACCPGRSSVSLHWGRFRSHRWETARKWHIGYCKLSRNRLCLHITISPYLDTSGDIA